MSEDKETIRLFDAEPYQTQFTALVLAVRPGKRPGTADVVLDETLFFPEEGGQTPDRGVLAGFPVVDVQIDRANVITHTLDVSSAGPCGGIRGDDHDSPAGRFPAAAVSADNSASEAAGSIPGIPASLAPGRTVSGGIDWTHRYSNMQNHSGEHVLSGLLHSLYGFENVGFRLSDNTVTLDTGGHLTQEQLLDLETKANEVVWSNVPVTCEYPSPEVLAALDYRSKKELTGAVRIVTIEGVDICACCAPHVRRTGEIGLIKILSAIRSRGGSTRITLVCGQRALLQVQHMQAQAEAASHLMNEPQDTIAEGVQRLQNEIAALKETCREKELQLIEAELRQIQNAAPGADRISTRDCWVFEGDLSLLSQRAFMNRLCDMGWRYAGVFCGSSEAGWKYLIGSRNGDARTPNIILKELLRARGGGKPDMVQGTVIADEKRIREVLQEVK